MKKTISGQALRKIRIMAGLTTSAVASALGVKSRKTIENWERDYCEPTVNQFLHYCQICEADPYDVVTNALKNSEM